MLSCAGCTVCLGRRRDRADGAKTYPYSWKDRDAGAPGRSVPPVPGTRRVPPAPPGRVGSLAIEAETEKETEKETETGTGTTPTVRVVLPKRVERTVPPRLPPRPLLLRATPVTKAR